MHNPLRDVLKLAVDSNASDIHIKTDALISMRIDGGLVECDFKATKNVVDKFIDLMLNDILLKKYEALGDVDVSYVEDDVGRFRVNIHKQRGSTGITMRHVKAKILDFKSLGLPPQTKKIAELERGIVFLTGTTGSGKSTTLASIINYINEHKSKHIITIEDPIEYEFFDEKSFIEQREVGLDTISFDSAFIHSLRQDPDIIVVGEMRSKESFDAALKAADTGHLIFSTLHTMNASQSINRLLDFYDASEHLALRKSLANSLAAIISQRLIPKITGKGVIPAVEIMLNTPIIQSLLSENKLDKLAPAIEGSKNEGMQTFNQALVDLVNEGTITEEQAIKFATNPEALKMNLRGVFLGTDGQILG
ncbi:MAG TPA: PilT/PilU family type 4a pilus ATPase [Victivallales bacterium]|nr:PilT/PilU family type 4a pilus ATPase [Victivallales bacterium]